VKTYLVKIGLSDNVAIRIHLINNQPRVNMDKRGRKELQKVIDKDPSCYVLITCGQPAEDGEMEVEMTYQGDKGLATFLLHQAKTVLDEEQDLHIPNSRNIRLVK
jgi:hypothetical protein